MLRQPDETMGRNLLCAESARAAGRFLAVAALAFGCARGSVLGGIQAPAAALFAAGACAGLSGLPLLAGCALGCASLGRMDCVWPAFACLCVWLALCVLGSVELSPLPARTRAGERLRRLCRLARGDLGAPGYTALAACIAGGANLLMTLALRGPGGAGAAYCAVSTLLGFGLTPVYAAALRAVAARKASVSERAALALLAAACASGLAGVRIGPVSADALLMSGALCLLAQGGGALKGLALGAALGAWGWLTGLPVHMAAAWAAAGCALGMKRVLPGALLGVLACALGAAAAGADAPGQALSAALGMAAGCAGHAASAPDRLGREARALLSRACDDERARLSAGARRLEGDLRAAVGEELPLTYARELEGLRGRLCAACAREEICWQRAASTSRASLVRLHAALLREGEVRPELLPRGCVRSESAASRLAGAAQAAQADEHRRELSARRHRLLTEESAHLRAECASALERELNGLRVDERASARALRMLRRSGARCVCVTADAPRRAYVELGGEESCTPAQAERALMRATGLDFEFLGGGDVLRLRQRSRLCVRGAVRRCAQGDSCGDSALLTRLSDGRWLAALSDGMGRGEAAARESCAAIAAMNRLLDDGVRPESAIDVVNALLQLSDDREMYATLDIALIDPQSGCADMYKLGAAPSLVVSGERARLISAGAPPFGILEEVSAAHRRARLRPGDRLMLMTDGVCDYSDERQERAALNLAAALAAQSPDEAAERMIMRMRDRFGNEDDAAVIVLDVAARQGGGRCCRIGKHAKREA